jgi:hypothetical protein
MKKLRDAVHYIINRQTDYTKLGKVKLNKILWFADRERMYLSGESITNATYIKLPNGPVPKKMDNILNSLIKEHKIIPKDVFVGGYIQKSYISIEDPDISHFNAYEISILDKYANEIIHKTANQISEISHDENWDIATIGETIPIETVFLMDMCTPTDADIEEGRKFFESI